MPSINFQKRELSDGAVIALCFFPCELIAAALLIGLLAVGIAHCYEKWENHKEAKAEAAAAALARQRASERAAEITEVTPQPVQDNVNPYLETHGSDCDTLPLYDKDPAPLASPEITPPAYVIAHIGETISALPPVYHPDSG